MPLVWSFADVPELPYEVRDQNNSVEIIEYLISEQTPIEVGTSIVKVQTWWAELVIESANKGFLEKNFFDSQISKGCRIFVGQPFALIFFDPDNNLPQKPYCRFRILRMLREKPKRN